MCRSPCPQRASGIRPWPRLPVGTPASDLASRRAHSQPNMARSPPRLAALRAELHTRLQFGSTLRASRKSQRSPALLAETSARCVQRLAVRASNTAVTPPTGWRPASSVPTAIALPTAVMAPEKFVKNAHKSFSFSERLSKAALAAVDHLTTSRKPLDLIRIRE